MAASTYWTIRQTFLYQSKEHLQGAIEFTSVVIALDGCYGIIEAPHQHVVWGEIVPPGL